jgi:RNA polymerase sigma-70 factor, ECF subfamily
MSEVQVGTDWERFRDFLALLARLRLDLSGVVQQTLLEAYQSFRQLEGSTEAMKAAWLRRALANNLNDEIRKMSTAKRGVHRQQSLEAQLAESASRMEMLLPSPQSSPSQHISREEQMLALAGALSTLPDNQRQAIEMHHLQGLSLAEVADNLGLTRPAIAGLLHRGMKTLRHRLQEGSFA